MSMSVSPRLFVLFFIAVELDTLSFFTKCGIVIIEQCVYVSVKNECGQSFDHVHIIWIDQYRIWSL